jgi:hypothetical protein
MATVNLTKQQKEDAANAIEAYLEGATIENISMYLRQMLLAYLKQDSPDTPVEYEDLLLEITHLFDLLDSLREALID